MAYYESQQVGSLYVGRLDLLTIGPEFTRPARSAAAAAMGHIARYLPPALDLSSATAAAVDRWDRRTDGRTLDRFMTLTAYRLCGPRERPAVSQA